MLDRMMQTEIKIKAEVADVDVEGDLCTWSQPLSTLCLTVNT